jgi:hypothetical protein
MRCAGYIAYLGEKGAAYRVWSENLREGDHLEDPRVDLKI